MALSEFQIAAQSHIKRLDGLIERGSVPRLRKLYTGAVSDLEGKLAKAVGSGASPFSVHQARTMLAQAKQGLIHLSGHMGTALNDQSLLVQQASANALITDIKKLEKVASGATVRLPIEQASRFAGIVDKRRTSLLKLNKTSMARYGSGVVAKVEQSIASSLLSGETGYKAIERVTETMDTEWWRAERIVRTETAWAYNATQMDAIGEATKEMPNMMMRWVEHVADVTLSKLDTRVGDDSRAMHGQLVRAGGYFKMPLLNRADLKISQGLLGQQWQFPPNRPNDRACVQPWRPGWGWGWELVGGARVTR